MLQTHTKLVFTELIGEISASFLKSTIKKYDGNYRTQHFDTESHLYSLLYSNFRNCKSLRELQTELSSNQKLNHLINVPSLSQFSRKNALRDYRIFEDIFYHLMNKAKRRFSEVNLFKDKFPIKIMDASVVLVALKLVPHLQMDKDRAGVKFNTLFNGEFPEKINICKSKVNDRRCKDGLIEDTGCIYLFDRGYYDYKWYDQLTDKGIKFVTRGVKNAVVMDEEFLGSEKEKDIYDSIIRMGTTVSNNLTVHKYREVMTFTEDGEPITFITNIFDLTKEEVILMYKKRWEIELFFKWIKQNLRIKKSIGYNENAIKIQIFSALITYMLIYLKCKIYRQNVKYEMLKITRILRVNLLEIWDDRLQAQLCVT